MATRNIQGLNVHLSTHPPVWFAQIEDLLGAACLASDDTWSARSVCEGILLGQFTLWVVHDSDALLGFYLTEYLFVESGIVVNVPFAGFKTNLKALIFAFDHAERVAKESGAVGFKFISSDTRWESLAKRRGFRPRFIEYYKEF